jgi:hypothetical protein
MSKYELEIFLGSGAKLNQILHTLSPQIIIMANLAKLGKDVKSMILWEYRYNTRGELVKASKILEKGFNKPFQIFRSINNKRA